MSMKRTCAISSRSLAFSSAIAISLGVWHEHLYIILDNESRGRVRYLENGQLPEFAAECGTASPRLDCSGTLKSQVIEKLSRVWFRQRSRGLTECVAPPRWRPDICVTEPDLVIERFLVSRAFDSQ